MSESTLAHWRNTLDLGELLLYMGEDLEREGLLETPERIVKAWKEMFSGYTVDIDAIWKKTFIAEGEGLQVCRNISFTSMCEHHVLPFYGTMCIGYQPHDKVIGLSKLSRIVDHYAKRLQIQERLVQQIADAIYENLEPRGVLVIADAQHFCCKGRGVKRDLMSFVTSAKRGSVDEHLFSMMETYK